MDRSVRFDTDGKKLCAIRSAFVRNADRTGLAFCIFRFVGPPVSGQIDLALYRRCRNNRSVNSVIIVGNAAGIKIKDVVFLRDTFRGGNRQFIKQEPGIFHMLLVAQIAYAEAYREDRTDQYNKDQCDSAL